MMAQIILESLSLDKIVFIPSSIPPHKNVCSSAEQRLKMIDAAIASNPAFESSDMELRRQGISYTVDTIGTYSEQSSDLSNSLHWLMGSDSFIEFGTWRSPEVICTRCRLAVFPRRDSRFEDGPRRFMEFADYVSAPQVDISSTMVREYVRSGRRITYMVPERVAAIIDSHGLYRI
jgi:nicotinate-nucleotide adenylyltransferase